MHSLIDNAALLRITLAAALVLTGAACSRSDRAPPERDTSQTASIGTAESQPATTGQPDTATPTTQADTVAPGTTATATDTAREDVSGYQPMARDTATAPSGEVSAAPGETRSARTQADTVAVGDSAHVGKTGERLEPSQATRQENADTAAKQSESDRVRPPEDSSETLGVTADTTTDVGVAADTGAPAEMARDTSLALAQGDTAMQQQSEVTVETADTVDTTDTTAVQVQVDTTTAEPQDQADLATETTAAGYADTLATDTERVRPPEDSTELQGNVTEPVDANIGNAEVEAASDTALVAAAGVPSTGNIPTGAHAVALMSREGRRCTVADIERSREVQWDLAASPATLNPCGTGTMTLPRVQMEE